MCEIVEYASMRLMLVCAIATMLPTAMESTEITTSIWLQSVWEPASASGGGRMMSVKAASFDAVQMNTVTHVGDPSYTSGSHMWNGTAPSLKPTPTIMNAIPNMRPILSAKLEWTTCPITASSRCPVTPYTMDMP